MDLHTLTSIQPRRDRYGRPLVTPRDGGKPVAYTRPTTIADTLDDRHNLELWMQRQVALGLVARPDLIARAATTDPTDKATLNGICSDARDAAGSSAAANMGTAIHAAVEAHNRGQEPPEMFAEVVERYRQTLERHGITVDPDHVEQFCVNEPVKAAGTFDMIVAFDGRNYIADLKTGSSVAWSGRSFAVQLAIYAGATSYYDPATETHTDPVEVDQDRALVVHLPAGGDDCTLYWLDIHAGREALEHALWVRDWRRRKDLLTAFDVPEVTNAEPDDRRERLVDALRAVKDADKDAFVATWRRELGPVPFPNRADEWTTEQMDAVEAAFELPWTDDVQPTVAPVLQMPERVPVEPQEDHGGLVDSETLSELRARINKLPRGAKGWMMAWNDDAIESGEGWRMGRGAHVSLRSYMTSLAGYWLARLAHDSDADDPQDDARLVLASVLGDAALMPTISVGRCLAALTLDEASLCQSIAQAAVEGAVRVNDAGLLEVAA